MSVKIASRLSISGLLEPRRGRRRLITRSGTTTRGLYPSAKAGRLVEYESVYERDAAEVLEDAPEVLGFREQPRPETWWDGERTRRYTADFAVETTHGPVLLEIKPAHVERRPRVRRRHACIRASLAARGTAFAVWSERQIRHPRRGVVRLLVAARRFR